MTVYSALLETYRTTLKRLPFFHRSFYRIGEKAITLIEKWKMFYTDPTDPLYYRFELLFRLYEPDSTKMIMSVVRPGDVCLDIGANVGYYTSILSKLSSPNGKVIAFEPHPRTYALLEKNLQKDNAVCLIQKAASDKNETLKIYDNPKCSGGTSMFKAYATDASEVRNELYLRAREQKKAFFHVEATTVDDVIENLGIEEVNFIKVDIEGAEIFALRGMRRTLLKTQQVQLVIEYFPQAQASAGFNAQDMITELQAAGFNDIKVMLEDGVVSPLSMYMDKNDVPAIHSKVNLLCRKVMLG